MESLVSRSLNGQTSRRPKFFAPFPRICSHFSSDSFTVASSRLHSLNTPRASSKRRRSWEESVGVRHQLQLAE